MLPPSLSFLRDDEILDLHPGLGGTNPDDRRDDLADGHSPSGDSTLDGLATWTEWKIVNVAVGAVLLVITLFSLIMIPENGRRIFFPALPLWVNFMIAKNMYTKYLNSPEYGFWARGWDLAVAQLKNERTPLGFVRYLIYLRGMVDHAPVLPWRRSMVPVIGGRVNRFRHIVDRITRYIRGYGTGISHGRQVPGLHQVAPRKPAVGEAINVGEVVDGLLVPIGKQFRKRMDTVWIWIFRFYLLAFIVAVWYQIRSFMPN